MSDMSIPYNHHHHHSTIAGPSSRIQGIFQLIYHLLLRLSTCSNQEGPSTTERERNDGEKLLESWGKR